MDFPLFCPGRTVCCMCLIKILERDLCSLLPWFNQHNKWSCVKMIVGITLCCPHICFVSSATSVPLRVCPGFWLQHEVGMWRDLGYLLIAGFYARRTSPQENRWAPRNCKDPRSQTCSKETRNSRQSGCRSMRESQCCSKMFKTRICVSICVLCAQIQ